MNFLFIIFCKREWLNGQVIEMYNAFRSLKHSLFHRGQVYTEKRLANYNDDALFPLQQHRESRKFHFPAQHFEMHIGNGLTSSVISMSRSRRTLLV